MRVNARNAIITSYLCSVFFISTLTGYKYFVDSVTYLDGYSNVFMQSVVTSYPYSTAMIAVINLSLIGLMLKKGGTLEWLIFGNPYYLLLATNVTKEQLVMFALLVVFSLTPTWSNVRRQWISVIIRFAAYLLLFVRPMYILYHVVLHFALRVRLWKINWVWNPFVIWLPITISFYVAYLSLDMQEVQELFLSRSEIEHTGREFFVDLCSWVRDDPLPFLGCAALSVAGLPPHSDIATYSYLTVVACVAPVYIILMRLGSNAGRFSIAILMIGFALVIFWWAPTYGAYIRYYFPLIWITYFLCRRPSRRASRQNSSRLHES